ncbi:uncharacterized protein LOC124167578 isoform X2 [Ischnura elegans]|nr:uncharacterized protein LOC124167578 isoform X2 [Ischnura elegans]
MSEYLHETKRALTSDGGCAEFTYSFVKSELVWKKIVDPVNGIKVKFGALQLKEMPVSTFADAAVELLLTKCSTLQAANKSLKKENDDLRTANTSLRTHVGSIAKLKSEMEEAVYAKSLAVLNAKKEKICELQEFIESRPTTSGSSHDVACKTKNIEKDVSPSKSIDLYGSETELDTDCSSDMDYSKKCSASKTGVATRVEEEDTDFMPTAAKSLKLGNASPEKAKVSIEREDNYSDDIFVPTRRKKMVKS